MAESPQNMAISETQLSIRLPQDLSDRADALAEHMKGLPEYALMTVKRAAVIRIAIAKGIEALEASYGLTPGKRPLALGEGDRTSRDAARALAGEDKRQPAKKGGRR